MTSDDILAKWVTESRQQSIDLVSDLDEEQLKVPYLDLVNPTVWELCHLAYFHELWILRRGSGQKPFMSNADSLFDSINIGHEERWRLKIPSKEEALSYVRNVRDRVLDLINSNKLNDKLKYLITYSVFHEDMHTEALTYARQTLGHPAPKFSHLSSIYNPSVDEDFKEEDAKIPGGKFMLGATKDVDFVFDNEKWTHEVDVDSFRISKTAVTEGQFAEFVD